MAGFRHVCADPGGRARRRDPGAARPFEEIRRAAREGAAAAFGGEAGRFGLDAPLPGDDLEARLAEMAASHCGALPAERLPGMVEVQRFRDAAIARAALAAFDEAGGQVVVITGNGHADKARGVPAMLAAAAPERDVFALGQTETGAAGDERRFDAVTVAAPPEREDPCAALMEESGEGSGG